VTPNTGEVDTPFQDNPAIQFESGSRLGVRTAGHKQAGKEELKTGVFQSNALH
jgi:hypothetical protein